MSSENYPVPDARDDKKQGGLSSLFQRATDKLPALSSVPHQLRQQAVRINPSQLQETLQLQLTIKALAGVVQDVNSLAREEQVFSKQLYTWSKEEAADIADISDRIALFHFKQSEIEAEAAVKVEQSRALLKDIRNFENDLVPRRRNAATLTTKLAALRKETPSKKSDEQVAKLTSELQTLEAENATFEASFDTLKRSKLHEAFALQFAALRERGEKLAIVGGYGELLLQTMESGGFGSEYKGKDTTARVKAELEDALKSWQPSPPPQLRDPSGSGFLNRSDSRSFGATHASQLSQLDATSQPVFSSSDNSTIPAAHGRVVPPVPPHPHQQQSQGQHDPFHDSHAPLPASSLSSTGPPPLPARPPSPLPPSVANSGNFPINLSPTARPSAADLAVSSPPHEMSIPLPPPGVDPHSPAGMAPAEPTVAETGSPRVGTGGPASGQLRPRRSSQQQQQQQAQPETYNAAQWGERPSGGTSMPGGFGSFGEAYGAPASDHADSQVGHEGETLPAYGEGDNEAARARDAAERILAEERERKAAV
ncbi:hypothetical protein JCM10213_003299 [Rhodosporidiobolus nylandii]